MERIVKTSLIAFCLFILWPGQAMAQAGCRCPQGRLNPGYHKYQVLEACGQPDQVYATGKDWNRKQVRYTTDWVYRHLGGGVVRIFKFEGSTLADIEIVRNW